MPAHRHRYTSLDAHNTSPYPDHYKGSVRDQRQPAPSSYGRPGGYHPSDGKSYRSTQDYGRPQHFQLEYAGHDGRHTVRTYDTRGGERTIDDYRPHPSDQQSRYGHGDLGNQQALFGDSYRDEGAQRGFIRDDIFEQQTSSPNRKEGQETGQEGCQKRSQEAGQEAGQRGWQSFASAGARYSWYAPAHAQAEVQIRPATQTSSETTYGGSWHGRFPQYANPRPVSVARVGPARVPFADKTFKHLLTRPVSNYSTSQDWQHKLPPSQHVGGRHIHPDLNPNAMPYFAQDQSNYQPVQTPYYGHFVPSYNYGQAPYGAAHNQPLQGFTHGQYPRTGMHGQMFQHVPHTQSAEQAGELRRSARIASQPSFPGLFHTSTHGNANKDGSPNKIDKMNRTHLLIREPKPTAGYMALSSEQHQQIRQPRALLVILDLNGTLIHRMGGTGFRNRPRVKEFLHYLFKNHSVMIWSSARAANVNRIVEKLLEPHQRQEVVSVWTREQLHLTPAQFNSKVQVYKHLSWVWQSEELQGKNPSNGVWSQNDTVLIDDSLQKAKSEPYNLIQIEEFEARPEQLNTDVLGQVVQHLEVLSHQANVSAYIKNVGGFKYNEHAAPFDWSPIEQSIVDSKLKHGVVANGR